MAKTHLNKPSAPHKSGFTVIKQCSSPHSCMMQECAGYDKGKEFQLQKKFNGKKKR